MTRPGICSVTLRRLDPDRVIAAVAGAGLERVEWGGDVHVPPGDEDTARRVRDATMDAGLAVASYGSYYRAGYGDPGDPEDFDAVLRSAVALGAPRERLLAHRAAGSGAGPPLDVLLEFVPGDDERLLPREAATMWALADV